MVGQGLTSDELLAAYESGRRNFARLDLDGICLAGAPLQGAVFDDSSLVAADLGGAQLDAARFVAADLSEATMSEADALGADFVAATMNNTDLRGAFLGGASFHFANCAGADLSGTTLDSAVFESTGLAGASFHDALLGGTVLFDLDVKCLCDVSLGHERPSSVDVRSVMKSYRHPRLKAFMVDCGIPEIFAEYMIDCAKALGDDLLQELMQSTFISYGGPDEAFARRLADALRAHGVVVFFFPETARVGERIGVEVFNALQRHDRMILVCSRASLDRPGVLNEIQETLDREARDGGASYLIPVLLDDYLLSEEARAHPLLARVADRVAADFRDPVRFDEELSRLLTALRKASPKTT
jgi:hypothetical protein